MIAIDEFGVSRHQAVLAQSQTDLSRSAEGAVSRSESVEETDRSHVRMLSCLRYHPC